MKLLVIFDKCIDIPPEKVCIHTGHANRAIANELCDDYDTWQKWCDNSYKNVLLQGKISDKLVHRIKLEKFYEIRDAGLDGIFEPYTLLGYAVLVENDCDDFRRIQTLKFKEKE